MIIKLYEFGKRAIDETGLTRGELFHLVDVVNSVHGREHDVLTIEYSRRDGRYYLRAHGSVGFAYYVKSGRRITLQVLPKPFKTDPDDRRSVYLFLQLLNLAKSLGMGDELEMLAREYNENGNIDELFKGMYVAALARAVHEGPHLEYGEVEEMAGVARGRILVNRLARKPPWRPEIPVRYSVMLEDNPLNRVLKWALEIVVKTSRWGSTKKLGGSLLGTFHDVGSPRPDDISRVTFNHLNERFRRVFELAEAIIQGHIGRGTYNRVLPGIFVSMDGLFEGLVYHTVRTALAGSAEVRAEESLPHPIRNAHDYELRRGAIFTLGTPLPDVVVRTPRGSCVIEVKYRNLNVHVRKKGRPVRKLVRKSSELYQAYTYAKLLGGGAILVYPRLEGRYNHWIPDMFEADERDVLRFFDGTKFAVLGYELSRVGNGVEIRRGRVKLDEVLKESLGEFLAEFCGGF